MKTFFILNYANYLLILPRAALVGQNQYLKQPHHSPSPKGKMESYACDDKMLYCRVHQCPNGHKEPEKYNIVFLSESRTSNGH